ncbi:hypothetical protein MC885_012698, partial [Smutsia gigantea]
MAVPAQVPVTRQVSGRAGPTPVASGPECGQSLTAAVAELPVLDASGRRVPFGALFRERRAVVVFVRHFLCYTCKEYVEDLARIPASCLQVRVPRGLASRREECGAGRGASPPAAPGAPGRGRALAMGFVPYYPL